MVTSCCVPGCKNRAGKNDVSFFRFPHRPESRRKAWIDIFKNSCHSFQTLNLRSKFKQSPTSQSPVEPSKFDRVCSDHFVCGKPNDDPENVDYLPSRKLGASDTFTLRKKTKSLRRSAKSTMMENKEQSEATLHVGAKRKVEENNRREEAATALLAMDSLIKKKEMNNKVTQTFEDPCAAWIITKAKLKHLEKELDLINKINTDLRSQNQEYRRAMQRLSSNMTTVVDLDSKKRKLEDNGGERGLVITARTVTKTSLLKTAPKATTAPKTDFVFKNFSLKKVLREDHRGKMICLNGELDLTGDGAPAEAVVLLERKGFEPSSVEETLRQARTDQILHNDIYSTHNAFSPGLAPDMKATVICPATEKHIAKYSEHEPFLVEETPELYRTVTEPCMKQSNLSIQWVYNILSKQTESERIVAEDPDPELGFVLLPDMKWDGKNPDQLYLVAIVHQHGLRSLRDLRAKHLPLLENIRDKGLAAVWERYAVPAHQMRVYFHYRPSYEHLHVHFTSLRLDSPPGSDCLRAHLLADVIDNIRSVSEFYVTKTLSYVVREGDELYKWYDKAGYFDGSASGPRSGDSSKQPAETKNITILI